MIRTFYRAANDDIITDCGSFAETRETAELYRSNSGFGGAKLYRAECEIAEATLLDLVDCIDAIALICERTGLEAPGAIGVDEWVPRISYALREAGIAWVRVRESFPADTITWIYVGADAPEMEELT
ncbi:MAG: hypothetical protein WC378_15515 [Opitutaceae bacterium]|jgi:hypothetical protein